ncbi:PASTA domain-containing protein [Streptomyces uncialis]|uniref:PASTA domain-containing protein n=1 Tax=Streptomyces uncialis TaxID=1048205 RepID=UPI0037A47F63
MHRRIVALLTTGLLTAGLALAGCGSPQEEKAKLPDLAGKGLQSAQDQAKEAGFSRLTSHDALGRGRLQALDRNWKVCGQSPEPGTHPKRTKIDLATVKLAEKCPAKDGELQRTRSTLLDFRGKSVRAVRQSLDSSASVTVNDLGGKDRSVVVESNWKVCTQKPAPGSAYAGEPVTLGVVKFGERC